MSIKLNTNNSDITIYDKINYDYATKDEIINLTITNDNNIREHIINIISYSLNLKDSEIELYKYIVYGFISIHNHHPNDDMLDLDFVIRDCSRYNKKSEMTYKRAIEILVTKGVITCNYNQRYIMLVNDFNIEYITNTAKFIVIKVKPTNVNS